MQYRKKPVVIEASQWFKNGDHPLDNAIEMFDYPDSDSPDAGITQRPHVVREGKVVRYYRHPDVSGDTPCEQCGQPHHVHGWIDTLEQGHRVCPGDWIITGVKGERCPCKPDVFAATYEPADAQAQQAADIRNRTSASYPAMAGDEGMPPLDDRASYSAEHIRTLIRADRSRQRVQPASREDARDAARYRLAAEHLILVGGNRRFGWPLAPVGKAQWDKYLDQAMQQERQL